MRFLLGYPILIIILVLASEARADYWTVSTSSYHMGTDAPLNEVNPGLFYTWEGELDTTAGLFKNSYGDWSPIIMVSDEIAEWDRGALSWGVGVTYYPDGVVYNDAHTWKWENKAGFKPVLNLTLQQGNYFYQAMAGEDGPILTTGWKF